MQKFAGIGLLFLALMSENSIAKVVIYHELNPPYNPDYLGTTPSPNDPNNYFFLRSTQTPDSYAYNINVHYYPIMRDQYFYRDYGDWIAGDWAAGSDYQDINTANYGTW